MDKTLIANFIGYIAAGIGMVLFLPQAIKSWRTKKTRDLSLLTYSLIAVVSVLWTVYGVLISAGPIILVNLAILLISIFILYLKSKYG